jgi:hypothetical protein
VKLSDETVAATLAEAMVAHERDRAGIMATMAVLDSVMAAIRLVRDAAELKERAAALLAGPAAKRGARSHWVWRRQLAASMRWSADNTPALAAAVVALGVATAQGYQAAAKGEDDAKHA